MIVVAWLFVCATYPSDVAPAGPPPATNQISIPVLVTTNEGMPVAGLTSQNFRLFEHKVEQQITNVTLDDRPASLSILVDTSGSMRDRLEPAAQAVGMLLHSRGSRDEAFLLAFAETPRIEVPFTRDFESVIHDIQQARPDGHTAMLDALDLAVSEMKNARNPVICVNR